MQAFDYAAPRSIAEAAGLLAQPGRQARILAGGTDLLVQLRENRRTADLVIDIKSIPEVNQLSYDPVRGLRIGAAVPCMRIWNDPTVAALYPGLIDAVALIGGVQIQARASIGGNLANASPAADSIPALIVHRAVCEIAGASGTRALPVESFCVAPGQNALPTGRISGQPEPPRTGAGLRRALSALHPS